MRYENAENLLQLALEMQASRTGLSLDDIERRFRVSRRTAQRMRDSILRLFPQTDELRGDDRKKRWRIPVGVIDRLLAFTADELADLEAAIRLLERENLTAQAESLNGLARKLTVLMKPGVRSRVAPDLEALIEAEGLAMRPGPRPRISMAATEALREAIKACRVVRIQYTSRGSGQRSAQRVCPYGFIYGHRHYLVAWSLHHRPNGYRLYSLPNIEAVEITSEPFARAPDFSLQDFAERAFGVFQEEPVDVIWRFRPEAAAVAREFLFHPRQTMETQTDGSLVVRFRCGGLVEMAWHLYIWGDAVEVIAPKALREMTLGYRRAWGLLP